jgi:hypothetical protein
VSERDRAREGVCVAVCEDAAPRQCERDGAMGRSTGRESDREDVPPAVRARWLPSDRTRRCDIMSGEEEGNL